MYLAAFVDGVLATVIVEIIVIFGLTIWFALKEGSKR